MLNPPPPVRASHFFLERVPGGYVNIGNGVGSVGGCMDHNAGQDFNRCLLSTGASYWVKLAESYLHAG
jgi:hippurate hydrolase